MTIRIVSFDPGYVTGFCEAIWNPGDDDFLVVKSSTIDWPSRHTGVRDLLLGTGEVPLPSVIVAESFRLYAHKAQDQIGQDFPSARILGVIETYAYEYGVLNTMILQPASVMSRVQIRPEHKSSLDKSEHARDAYKHLRYWIVMHKETYHAT
jgi:hypothetical protein